MLERTRSAGDENLLILCDELMVARIRSGRGTGASHAGGAGRRVRLIVVTTHFDSLKALAESDERFRNAGMEYDLLKLRPTFRLKDGMPGRSYALDIAARIGLPDSVLARARACS